MPKVGYFGFSMVLDSCGKRIGIIDRTRVGLKEGEYYAAVLKDKKLDKIFSKFGEAREYILKIGV